MLAPRTTLRGALSPPMASRAMVRRSPTMRCRYTPSPPGLAPRRRAPGPLALRAAGAHHFAPIIIAASAAHVMGKLHLAAIGALVIAGRLQMVVRAMHVAARLGNLLLGKGHGKTRALSLMLVGKRKAPQGRGRRGVCRLT